MVHVEAVSALYESQPQPPAPPPDYLNAACRVSTSLTPQELRRHTYDIERQLGRVEGAHWSPRPLDIDILLFAGQVIETEELVIPHRLLLERAFVLQPLLDIDPELIHPLTGERLSDALQRLGASDLTKLATDWYMAT